MNLLFVDQEKRCSCSAVAVDGGKEYLKRLGNEKDYEELSIKVKK